MQIDDPGLVSFLEGLNKILNYKECPTKKNAVIFPGKKYMKIVIQESHTPEGLGYVYCFIAPNGDILKPAGWSGPAKHARGNIFAEDNGLKCCGPFGVAYRR